MNGGEEEHLLSAPLRIVWQHSHNWPNYKLTLTAYGDGEVCEQEGKHPCFKLGEQNLVCISDELLCDDVRHCPSGALFDSDEGPAICANMEKRKKQWFSLFRDYLQKSYKASFPNLFPNDATVIGGQPLNVTAVGDVGDNRHHPTSFSVTSTSFNNSVFVVDSSSIRKNFPKGLSKYGPWGYLMLGMLLCGGALLVCGLWGEWIFLLFSYLNEIN